MSAGAINKTPLYKYSAEYARENGELKQYRESRRANAACKKAIEAAVEAHWDGMRLSDDCANDVLREFGPERVAYVLANTLQYKDHDERFSHANRDWAKTVRMYVPAGSRDNCIVESHPAKLDFFVDAARREMERERKPSIRGQLSAAPVHGANSAAKTADREAR